jgi:hypothetical protein
MDDCGGRRWGGRELELEEVRGTGSPHLYTYARLSFVIPGGSVWGGWRFGRSAFGEVSFGV